MEINAEQWWRGTVSGRYYFLQEGIVYKLLNKSVEPVEHINGYDVIERMNRHVGTYFKHSTAPPWLIPDCWRVSEGL